MKKTWFLLLLAATMICCSEGLDENGGDTETPAPPPGTVYSINGSVQKGPFTQGTSITIQALDDKLNPTGKNYQTTTSDDAGSFTINNQIDNRYVEVIASGYYFNEVLGKLSSSPIVLRAICDLSEIGKTNVNLLTTLESDRIRALVSKNSLSIKSARESAEKEILKAFNIPNDVTSTGVFDKMDITKDGEANAILLALSATLQSTRSEAELSELVAKIAGELVASGEIRNESLKKSILDGGKKVNSDDIKSNLKARYQQLGITDYAIPPFEDYLDVNGNGKVDKNDNWLIPDQTQHYLSDLGGTISFTISHNIDYDIILEDSWIRSTVNKSKGYLEEDLLSFTIDRNSNYDDRDTRIGIKDKNSAHTEYVVVNQKQKDAITVTSSRYEVGIEGGNINVEVKANVEYTSEISDDGKPWIHLVSSRAMNTRQLSYKIDRSYLPGVRSGSIVFRSGAISETVTVYQSGEKVLVLTQKDYSVPDVGSEITVEVSSNFDYEIVMPAESWVTRVNSRSSRAIITNTHKFTIHPNNTYDNRSSQIIFRDKNSPLIETVNILQLQKTAILPLQDVYNLTSGSCQLGIDMQTNTTVKAVVTSGTDWLSVIDTPESRSLENKTLYFAVNANLTNITRKGYVTLSSADNSISKTIEVIQSGSRPISIPDYEFKKYLLANFDTDKDGSISVDEALAVKIISKYGNDYNKIRSLEGIEHFVNLEELNVQDNAIVSVDLSKNTKLKKLQMAEHTGYGQSSYLKSVILPASIEELADNAFSGCKLLETVTFPADSELKRLSCKDPNSGYGPFTGCESLKSIKLPEGLTEIGGNAFLSCEKLSSITIPSTVTKIGNNAFARCLTLQNITIPDDNIISIIGEYAFGNTAISSFTIPKAVTKISNSMFYYCINLKSINIPSRIVEIGDAVFGGCASLSAVNFEAGSELKILGNNEEEHASLAGITSYAGVFEGCELLTNIQIPKSVTSIGHYAFKDVPKLTSIKLPESITEIKVGTFAGSCGLQSIEIPANVESITGAYKLPDGRVHHDDVFGENLMRITFAPGSRLKTIGGFSGESLTQITIPEGVATIEPSAFYGSALISINIPASVTSIGNRAFMYTEFLNNITFSPNGKLISIGEEAFSRSQISYITLPNTVTYIGNSAFYFCSNLSIFRFPDNEGFTTINTKVLGCTGVKSVYIPKNVTSIQSYAFEKTPLESVEFAPDSKLTIIEGGRKGDIWLGMPINTDYGAFIGCEKLKDITIPANVECISENAFKNCYALEKVTFAPNCKVKSLGGFRGCTAIKGFDIPASVEEVTNGAFDNCQLMTTLNFSPNGKLKKIGTEVFNSCGIASINLPATVTTLSESSFSYANKLVSFSMADNNLVTAIPVKTFYYCSELTNVTLSKEITQIGTEAFFECRKLANINIPAGSKLSVIQNGAFTNCEQLNSLTIGAEEPPLCGSAFIGMSLQNCKLYVPAQSVEKYRNTHTWSSFGTILPMP